MSTTDTNKTISKEWVGHWCVACLAAFLLLPKHLKMYTMQKIRYQAFWGTGDAVALALDIALLGMLLFVVYEFVLWTKVAWARRVADALFVMLIGFRMVGYPRTGWRDAAMPWLPGLCTALTCLIVAVGLLITFRKSRVIPGAVYRVCLLFSPIVPIALVQLFLYPIHSITNEAMPSIQPSVERPAAHSPEELGDVYVVILDQWSYARTCTDGRIVEELPNIRAFARSATIYHDAHSPFPETMRSLPSILYQTADEFQYQAGRLGLVGPDGKFDGMNQRSSLFAAGHLNGYRTFMIGLTHPYRRLFGSELDYSYSVSSVFGNLDDRMIGTSMVRHLFHGLAGSLGSVPKPAALQWRLNRFWQQTSTPSFLTYAPKNLASIHGRSLAVIRDQPGSTLAVFHYPVPHDPYIYSRRGVDLSVCERMPLIRVPQGDGTFLLPNPDFAALRYQGNLEYADTLVGELINALKEADKYDRSLIILTSDHNWNLDPDFEAEMTHLACTHVPLLVKKPHQRVADQERSPFFLTALHELIFKPEQLARTDGLESHG